MSHVSAPAAPAASSRSVIDWALVAIGLLALAVIAAEVAVILGAGPTLDPMALIYVS